MFAAKSIDLLPKFDFHLCFSAVSPNSERDRISGRSAAKSTLKIVHCFYRFTGVCKDYVALYNPGARSCLIRIDRTDIETRRSVRLDACRYCLCDRQRVDAELHSGHVYCLRG